MWYLIVSIPGLCNLITLNKHSVLENVIITKIACVGSCICIFSFLHLADAKSLSVSLPSVRPSTNKTNESVSSDEPAQIRKHANSFAHIEKFGIRRLRQIIRPLSLALPDNYAHMPSDRRACKL